MCSSKGAQFGLWNTMIHTADLHYLGSSKGLLDTVGSLSPEKKNSRWADQPTEMLWRSF